MKRDLAWWLRIAVPTVAVAALGVGLAAGFGGTDSGGPTYPAERGVRLVAYDTCETALRELRNAALPNVTAYGLGGGYPYVVEDSGAVPPNAPKAAAGAESSASARDAAPDHSATNTHEAGVDEPDLVKTDGKRVVTIADGRLHVVDVAGHAPVASLDLPGGQATQLLLSGDRALVVTAPAERMMPRKGGPPIVDPPGGTPPVGMGEQSQLVLVDVSGGAKVLGTLTVDGGYLDARQVGSVARVVVRSGPRLQFRYPDGRASEQESLRLNQDIVRNSSISDWLPRYTLDSNGRVSSGQLVECGAVSHPASYTGAAMLTVLSLDLGRELGTGDPVSIVADGDTVYGTGSSLYVADDHSYHGKPGGFAPRPSQHTELYQFDISKPGKPVYVASGGVDGGLLNQYSLSEYAGTLRIATTFDQPGACCDQPGKSESVITVLRRNGNDLVPVGKLGGLGVGERIYAARFLGPVAYLVTFRQTDPLYTVDLSDPAKPRLAGELKLTGFSAYLHPAGDNRLIGLGQEATEQGRRTGTQVSLFDTGNLAAATRLAQFQLPGGSSEAEVDPHAFLYWQDLGIVVVPVMRPSSTTESGALVLRLSGNAFTQLGMISHPANQPGYPDPSVRRALVIGEELWTVSGSGLMVNHLNGLVQKAWIPFG
jgi:uncharacterized secreted protein with C-terminal beta-propeller domain